MHFPRRGQPLRRRCRFLTALRKWRIPRRGPFSSARCDAASRASAILRSSRSPNSWKGIEASSFLMYSSYSSKSFARSSITSSSTFTAVINSPASSLLAIARWAAAYVSDSASALARCSLPVTARNIALYFGFRSLGPCKIIPPILHERPPAFQQIRAGVGFARSSLRACERARLRRRPKIRPQPPYTMS